MKRVTRGANPGDAPKSASRAGPQPNSPNSSPLPGSLQRTSSHVSSSYTSGRPVVDSSNGRNHMTHARGKLHSNTQLKPDSKPKRVLVRAADDEIHECEYVLVEVPSSFQAFTSLCARMLHFQTPSCRLMESITHNPITLMSNLNDGMLLIAEPANAQDAGQSHDDFHSRSSAFPGIEDADKIDDRNTTKPSNRSYMNTSNHKWINIHNMSKIMVGSGRRIRVPQTFQQLLDECTRKLGLNFAAKRLYSMEGTLIVSLQDIENEMDIVVSTGPTFKQPRYSPSKKLTTPTDASPNSLSLRDEISTKKPPLYPPMLENYPNNPEDISFLLLYESIEAVTSSEPIQIPFPASIDELMATCSNAFGLQDPLIHIYDVNGKHVLGVDDLANGSIILLKSPDHIDTPKQKRPDKSLADELFDEYTILALKMKESLRNKKERVDELHYLLLDMFTQWKKLHAFYTETNSPDSSLLRHEFCNFTPEIWGSLQMIFHHRSKLHVISNREKEGGTSFVKSLLDEGATLIEDITGAKSALKYYTSQEIIENLLEVKKTIPKEVIGYYKDMLAQRKDSVKVDMGGKLYGKILLVKVVCGYHLECWKKETAIIDLLSDRVTSGELGYTHKLIGEMEQRLDKTNTDCELLARYSMLIQNLNKEYLASLATHRVDELVGKHLRKIESFFSTNSNIHENEASGFKESGSILQPQLDKACSSPMNANIILSKVEIEAGPGVSPNIGEVRSHISRESISSIGDSYHIDKTVLSGPSATIMDNSSKINVTGSATHPNYMSGFFGVDSTLGYNMIVPSFVPVSLPTQSYVHVTPTNFYGGSSYRSQLPIPAVSGSQSYTLPVTHGNTSPGTPSLVHLQFGSTSNRPSAITSTTSLISPARLYSSPAAAEDTRLSSTTHNQPTETSTSQAGEPNFVSPRPFSVFPSGFYQIPNSQNDSHGVGPITPSNL